MKLFNMSRQREQEIILDYACDYASYELSKPVGQLTEHEILQTLKYLGLPIELRKNTVLVDAIDQEKLHKKIEGIQNQINDLNDQLNALKRLDDEVHKKSIEDMQDEMLTNTGEAA